MSSYSHQFDDPEKHLLGNLLCDDDSFVQHNSSSSTSVSSSASSNKGFIAPAPGGAIGTSSTFWPEPPPPYSPPNLPALWQRSCNSRVTDWDSLLLNNYVENGDAQRFVPFKEPSKGNAMGAASAPVSSSNLPFSYRDVATRGVKEGESGWSGAAMKGEEEGRMERGDGEEKERTKGQVDDGCSHGTLGEEKEWHNVPSSKSTSSERPFDESRNFQQIVRRKGGQTKNTSKSKKATFQAVPIPTENVPLEDASRFTVLEKLSVNDAAEPETRSVSGAVSTRSDRVRSGQTKKGRRNGRNEDRRECSVSYRHACLLLAYLRGLMVSLLWMCEKVIKYVVELTLDVCVKGCALLSFTVCCWATRIRRRANEWTMGLRRMYDERRRREVHTHALTHNIRLPDTGEEALDRLIHARGRDAYCILGVRQDASDQDIKTYYKRQALLVHPDKNKMEGAAEAFQILSKAFDLVGTESARAKYDEDKMKGAIMNEMAELYAKLKEKLAEARHRMDCDCGECHLRVPTNIPQQAARYCRRCDMRHPAKNLDIWAESRYLGMVWIYYTCVNGMVYDITSWATCKANDLKHVKADGHSVMYRLVSSGGSREMKSNSSEKLLRMMTNQVDRAAKLITQGHTAQASLQPLEREEERPRKARRRNK